MLHMCMYMQLNEVGCLRATMDSANTLPNTLLAVDGKQLTVHVHVHLLYIG